MARHNHRHSESGKRARSEKSPSGKKQLHKDWRVWLIVSLMLLAMILYVLSLDDSVVPTFMR